MDYIKINPIEELLKAIEIVHGRERADMWRRILLSITVKKEAFKNVEF
jgi:hypothetical protein